jgi:CheY-like chemotaxis protein
MDSDTLQGKELLILEDELATCTLYRAFFKGICSVDVVHTPEEVFERVDENAYSLLLLDIHLKHEECDGGGVLRRVRKREEYTDTPIIAVTAHAMPGDKTRRLVKKSVVEYLFCGYFCIFFDVLAFVE